VIVAWAIAQVIDLLSQIFALPDWIAQPIVIVLAIGFPVTLIVAWLIEGQTHKAETADAVSPATKVDWLIAGGLAAVLAFMGYQQLTPGNVSVARAGVLPNSVAVLPFENLSLDPENAFFASGVHDEIINQLSKLRNLTVIARSSVMDYPESGKSNPEIADELNVEMIMAGSVRYAGDEVRVTAELFNGATNVPVWTDAYDGDLSDIFAIQADIAMNIANSLQAEFSVAEQESIEAPLTDSPEAYLLYQRALALAREGIRGDRPGLRGATQEYLDQAIRLDPGFAMAYAWKAHVYATSRDFDHVAEENRSALHVEMDRLIGENADMALALDPSIGFAHAVLAEMHFVNSRLALALAEAEQALQLSPNEPDVLTIYSMIKSNILDQFDEAIELMERAAERDPNNALVFQELGSFSMLDGRFDTAATAYQKCLELGGNSACSRFLAASEFGRGDNGAALEALRVTEQISVGSSSAYAFAAYMYGRMGQPDEAIRVFESAREAAVSQYLEPSNWAFAYMGVGDYDEAYNQLDTAAGNIHSLTDLRMRQPIRLNLFADPVLEEPKWVELRGRLRPM